MRNELPDAKCGCPRYEDRWPDPAKTQTGCGHTPECKAKMRAQAKAANRPKKRKKR